jgi:WD40 repeat protein
MGKVGFRFPGLVRSSKPWLRKFCLRLAGIALLTACSSQPAAPPTTSPPPGQTAIPSVTSTPSPVPAPRLPVAPGTPVPEPTGAISNDSIGEVDELARWGKGVITDAAYSPDGKWIGVASTIGISLHQADTLDELVFMEADSAVRGIAFSPDGKTLAAGLDSGSIEVWTVEGALVRSLEGHGERVNSVAFSPDGDLLASGSVDATVRLWQVSDGTLIGTLRGHNSAVSSVAFSPDGLALFSGSQDGTVQMRQIPAGELLRRFRGHNIVDLSISADGKILAAYEASSAPEGGVLNLWQIESGEKLQSIKGGQFYAADIHDLAFTAGGELVGEARYESDIRSVALSPDGQYVAAGWSNYTAKIWDAASGGKQKTFDELMPEQDPFYRGRFAVAFSPDGQSLMLAGFNVLGTWDLATGTQTGMSEVWSEPVRTIDLSRDEKTLAAVEGSTVRLWAMADGTRRPTQGRLESSGGLALLPDGRSLAMSSFDGLGFIWPATPQGIRRSFEPAKDGDFATAVRVSPDGELLAIGMSYPGTIELLQVSDGKLLQIMSLEKATDEIALAFSPDGAYLASCASNAINAFRVPARKPYRSFKGAISMAFSPDGKLIAGGAEDGTMHVWEFFTGKTLFTLSGPQDAVRSLAFSPDGNLLAAGSTDGTITVWSVADGELLKTWKAHTDAITGLIFGADGRFLISSSWDGTIRFWGLKP